VNNRALAVAISLLTAAIGVALPGMIGCSALECSAEDELWPFELGVSADLHAVAELDDHDGQRGYDGIAVGAEGTIVVWGRDDAGDFEEAVEIGTADLRAISWKTGSWWVVGDAGTVAVSGDRGQTWVPVALPTTADLHAIAHVGNDLVITGDDVVLVQGIDGMWIDVPAPNGSWGLLRALQYHADRLYAVGLGGVIWSTTDPRGEWVAEDSGTESDLLAIGSSDTVVAVGAGGTLLVRQSGSWQRRDTGVSEELVAYTDGHVLAANGVIFDVGSGGQLSPLLATGSEMRAMSGSLLMVGANGAAYRLVWGECYGRPFIVDGQAHAASPRWGDAPHDSRAAIAETWARAGLYEHASVASFARFALELLALGAPPRLLRDLQGAIADELRHAHSCFELARRFGGVAVGPGPMPLAANAFERIGDPISTALALFDEACVEESVAACMAAEAAGRCDDPEVRRVLEGIAIDERRHAVAGWAALRWMLDTFGERVREPLRARLARLRPSNPVLAQLVLPLARAMLHPDTLHSVEVVS
jgi:hypothetical protein